MATNKLTKTPLTDTEKLAVKALLATMTVAEVSEATKKAPEVINRFVAEMADSETKEAAKRSPEVNKMINQVKARLMSQAKATPEQAEQILRKALKNLKRDPSSTDELFAHSLRNIPASALMGGKPGVTVGGPAVSAKGDDFKKNLGNSQKLPQSHLFQVNGKPYGEK